MPKTEIALCPFCGGGAVPSYRYDGRVFHSGKRGCPLEGMDFLLEQWNRRVGEGDCVNIILEANNYSHIGKFVERRHSSDKGITFKGWFEYNNEDTDTVRFTNQQVLDALENGSR